LTLNDTISCLHSISLNTLVGCSGLLSAPLSVETPAGHQVASGGKAEAATARGNTSSMSLTLEALDFAEEAAVAEAAGSPASTSLPPLATCLMGVCWANILDKQYSCSWELRQVGMALQGRGS